MDDKAEIVAFARESAKAGVDLYDLLGVDGSTSRDDIHRAWRRKGLKYHPDKAGANYDPTLYERFARARDVLVDDEARKVYDTGRAAAAQRRLQSEQMSAERRRFKDELEAAEREHGAAAAAAATAAGMGRVPFGGATSTSTAPAASTERDKLREAGRRRAEERQRREQEAQDRVRQREDERIAEIEQRLRDKEDKARRRAERKGGVRDGDSSKPAAPDTAAAAAATAQQAPLSQPDAEWRKLLKTGAAQAKAGDAATVQQRPLFAYTMDRLKAAGTAQRRHAAGDASTTVTPFEPQWEEIDDPEVRKFITRVPKFPAAAPSARTGHVPMDTAA
ncbi:hypothetical protein HMPREF1624_03050 [Sporothrix schenckii ATCC 58251]|uniref:J domain-containing protein n=1 Tax=Sporothrix schenckii (strain ATCC 58251 / de Perez 2211183) TaxID=1391915 RepID=U7PVR5_SPOS1|nr:hypothetical protein HMPREF1624_03050 [Sporothrix schenckii ATCC 58251]